MNTIWKTNPAELEEESKKSFFSKWGLLLINMSCTAVGYIGGPLLLRMYFLHGGSRKWLSSWLQTAGFPVLLIPLTYLYFRDLRKFKSSSKFFANPLLLACSAFIGVLTGLEQFSVLLWSVFPPHLNLDPSFVNPTCFYSFFCLCYV